MYTTQFLSYGNTAQEAAYTYNSLSAFTAYYCDPTFTTTTGATIGFSMFVNSGLTTPAIAGYYSNGVISRYYDGYNTLEKGVVDLYSAFLVGCCDNKLYKFYNNNKFAVGSVMIVSPNNFCYTVVEEPTTPQPYDILNTTSFSVVSPEENCNFLRCQPCPPPQPTPPPGPAIPGVSVNLCDPITLLPMGIKCMSINPTEDRPNSGVLSLTITGGTAPYTVIWTLPNNTTVSAQTIYNKSVGTYPVVVYDRYGDFSASTTCTLEIIKDCSFSGSVIEFYTPTPTPSPTPTHTPTPTPTSTPIPTPAPPNGLLVVNCTDSLDIQVISIGSANVGDFVKLKNTPSGFALKGCYEVVSTYSGLITKLVHSTYVDCSCV